MTKFEEIKIKNIDEFAAWLCENGLADNSPWIKWWDENYCKKCPAQYVFSSYLGKDIEVSHCELHHKCFFFPDMESEPEMKEIIKLWLESEADKEGESDA